MTKVPNFGIHSLETEYLEARRSIYKKFVKVIISLISSSLSHSTSFFASSLLELF